MRVGRVTAAALLLALTASCSTSPTVAPTATPTTTQSPSVSQEPTTAELDADSPDSLADITEPTFTDEDVRKATALAASILETLSSTPGFAWRMAVAASGAQLPGGGITLFPDRRIVALYGHPSGPALGMLGEQDVAGSVERVQALAAEYQALTDDLVIPGFEIIATIASQHAGDDGDYSSETPIDDLRPLVDAAAEAGIYVVLDLQPGRTDFLTQARLYEELLLEPHVGLALDPEWRLGPDQRHLVQIGSVGVDEINEVVTWLADLTRDNSLPQKLLVLHQFQTRMITERERLDLTRPELAVMIHVDGQGAQGAKQGTWAALRQGAQDTLWWGWKNFVDEDTPAMLSPAETYSLVDPIPNLVSYQ